MRTPLLPLRLAARPCVAVLLLGSAACAPDSLEDPTTEAQDPLTQSLRTDDWPMVVRADGGAHGCGASVLSNHWLLTAAHCVEDTADGTTVDLITSKGVTLLSSPAHYVIHPDYGGVTDWGPFGNSSDTDHDAALIRVDGDIGMNDRMGIYLSTPYVGETVTIVGYGYGSDPGESSTCDPSRWGDKRFHAYHLKTVTSDKLEIDYGNSEVCPGDSGSPWIPPVVGGIVTTAGINANRRPIGDADASRVSTKLDWMLAASHASPAFELTCPDYPAGSDMYAQCFEPPQAVWSLAAGRGHACAVRFDHQLYCWGSNGAGQLGDTTTIDRTTPVRVVSAIGSAFVAVAAGWDHTCAITTDGEVECVGSNAYGQLGDPNLPLGAVTTVTSAVRLAGGAPLTEVKRLAAGAYHTCAQTTDGHVYCWGRNDQGQLGNDTTRATNYATEVGTSGLILEQGANFLAPPRTLTPFDHARDIVAGYAHTCAIREDGTAWCWGDNSQGQLGTGGSTDSLHPAIVARLTNVFRISAGYLHTCATYGSAGDHAACWGYNNHGQLGIGTTQSSRTPAPIALGLGVAVSVSAGRYHTCFIGTNGQAKCTGSNIYGEAGTGQPSSHVPLTSPLAWSDADYPAAGEYFTCTRFKDGTVACTGLGSNGRLGNESTTGQAFAVHVKKLHGPS